MTVDNCVVKTCPGGKPLVRIALGGWKKCPVCKEHFGRGRGTVLIPAHDRVEHADGVADRWRQ